MRAIVRGTIFVLVWMVGAWDAAGLVIILLALTR